MVKIAVAGGSGNIAGEIIDALHATGKHEILILSRKEVPLTPNTPGISWIQTDYSSKSQLTGILTGVDTVLSFVAAHMDPGSKTQKMLIDACVEAGVRRFAPSEWSSSSLDELPWYAEKGTIRTYLAELNVGKKVLEYTLFQPGGLTDMFLPLDPTRKFQMNQELWIDFRGRRAIILEGEQCFYSLITMRDLANVVVKAVEWEGTWPVVGGIRGETVEIGRLLEIGAKTNGGNPFAITALPLSEVQAGTMNTPWIPSFNDPNLTPEQVAQFSKIILRGSLLSGLKASWVVSDEWNRLLPEYSFEGVEEFLLRSWAGKREA